MILRSSARSTTWHTLGFEAQHAALYSDPITGKQREFDIRACYTLRNNKIALAIECKGLKTDYPLVVSCVPRTRSEAYHEILQVSEEPISAYVPAPVVTRLARVPSDRNLCIYPVGHGVGKSMRQVKRERARGELRGQIVSGDDVFDASDFSRSSGCRPLPSTRLKSLCLHILRGVVK
jgi:hypothetical protein